MPVLASRSPQSSKRLRTGYGELLDDCGRSWAYNRLILPVLFQIPSEQHSGRNAKHDR